jgi:transketolase
MLRDGNDGLILANGIMVGAACQAAEILEKDGIDITVADIHTVQPLDIEGLLSLVKKHRTVFVAEEHNTRGGVATAVADTLIDARASDVRLIRIGLPPDEYAIIGPPYYLYQHYGLDGAGLAKRVRQELK